MPPVDIPLGFLRIRIYVYTYPLPISLLFIRIANACLSNVFLFIGQQKRRNVMFVNPCCIQGGNFAEIFVLEANYLYIVVYVLSMFIIESITESKDF